MSNRILLSICLLAVVVCCGLTGCSMCCGPYDFHYPTFGGKHQRVDPTHGRVGSVYSDPNVQIGPASDSNLAPHAAIESPRVPADDSDDDDFDDLDDDDLEPIAPLEDDLDSDIDELPEPDDKSEVTASRAWRHRPLRRNFEYR